MRARRYDFDKSGITVDGHTMISDDVVRGLNKLVLFEGRAKKAERENTILRKELRDAREKIAKLTQANELMVFRLADLIEVKSCKE